MFAPDSKQNLRFFFVDRRDALDRVLCPSASGFDTRHGDRHAGEEAKGGQEEERPVRDDVDEPRFAACDVPRERASSCARKLARCPGSAATQSPAEQIPMEAADQRMAQRGTTGHGGTAPATAGEVADANAS